VQESNPRNVVVLVMDTARAKTVFGDEGPDFSTLSQLSESGEYCRTAFADAPWTLPSHASLFTGTPPSVHGAHAGHKGLADNFTTMAEIFSRNGFRTGAFTNNAWVTDDFGLLRGFDDTYRIWQFMQSDVDLGPAALEISKLDLLKSISSKFVQGNPLKNIINALYGQFFYRNSDYGAKRTNKLIRQWIASSEEPFFLFANYLEPHLEYRPPKRYASEYLTCDYEEAMDIPQDPWDFLCGETNINEEYLEHLNELYRAEIAYLDHRLGELIDWFKDNGYFDDTLFIIVGDHGENIGEHGLMDHQYCLYDSVLRVPLIVRGGGFGGGQEIEELIQLSDILPTLMDIFCIDDDARSKMKGQSFAPHSDTQRRSFTLSEYLAPQPSLETLKKRYDSIPGRVKGFDRKLRSIRTLEHRLILGTDGMVELYDASSDTDEQADIAAQNPDLVEKLKQEMSQRLPPLDTMSDSSEGLDIEDGVQRHLEDLGYL